MALKDLFTDIADSIRYMGGAYGTIVANDFPEKIKAIPRGDISVVPLNVTENGIYTPQSGEAFGQVNVNVSGGGGGFTLGNKLNGQLLDPQNHLTHLYTNVPTGCGFAFYPEGTNWRTMDNYYNQKFNFCVAGDTGNRMEFKLLSNGGFEIDNYAGAYDTGDGGILSFKVVAFLNGACDTDTFRVKTRNPECMLKGTMIMLSDGTEKPIEDITYDDELLVWNFDEGKLDKAKPLWIAKPSKADYYFKNTLANGKILYTTGKSKTGWGHRMFDTDKNRFVYTTESVSDMIYTLDGNTRHLSCERIEDECEYYNIITDKHINLFANRILTSCSYNNIYPIKEMKFVKEGRTERDISEFSNISKRWISGMRLTEQTYAIEDIESYVKNLEEKDSVVGVVS